MRDDLIGVVEVGTKKFYFNIRKTQKSGEEYLCINGISGDYKDRLVIFKNQVVPVWEMLSKAVERLVGLAPVETVTNGHITYKCPGCGSVFTEESSPEVFGTYVDNDSGDVYCNHWGCPRGSKHPIRGEMCTTWRDRDYVGTS